MADRKVCGDESSHVAAECLSCGEILAADHTGVRCLQNHNLCAECSVPFVQNTLAEGVNIPVKCPTCVSKIIPATFERQLDAKDLKRYNELIICAAAKEKNIHHVIITCPSCALVQIREAKVEDLLFIHCPNPNCPSQMSCYHCRAAVPNLEPTGDEEEEFDEHEADRILASHMDCAVWGIQKADIELVLKKGMVSKCPKCNLAGQKDDACTHMICIACQTSYCYVCESEMPDGDFKEHNEDWFEGLGELDDLRCPMFLTEIDEIDETWPDEDRPALEMLHYIRSIALLRKYLKTIPPATFSEIMRKFPRTLDGYDLKDLTSNDNFTTPFSAHLLNLFTALK